jgi:TnpA family transposase
LRQKASGLIFTLDFLRDIELRRRIQAGLNKGEARNAWRGLCFSIVSASLREPTAPDKCLELGCCRARCT